jgi:hypothetical protein
MNFAVINLISKKIDMKKIFLFVGCVTVLTLTSCTKDWNCKCTNNNSETSYHAIPSATLHDADATCESYQYNNAFGYNNCALMVD